MDIELIVKLEKILIKKIERAKERNDLYGQVEGFILLDELVYEPLKELDENHIKCLANYTTQHEKIKQNPEYETISFEVRSSLYGLIDEKEKCSSYQQFFRFYDVDEFVCSEFADELIPGVTKQWKDPITIDCYFSDDKVKLKLPDCNPDVEDRRLQYEEILAKASENKDLIEKLQELYEDG